MRVLLASTFIAAFMATLASVGSVGLSVATSSEAHAQRPPFKKCLKRCMNKGHNEYSCRNRCIRK